jgi:cytochrome c556
LKRSHHFLTFALVEILLTACLAAACVSDVLAQHGHEPEKKHGLSVKQYESFHDVLHPLEHDALPKNDFARIRAQSALLVKRGNAIVKLGVPRGVTAANKEEFVSELSKFKAALAKFRGDAKKRTDEELRVSFSAVHDSFEMLAGMLPRN